MNTVYRDVHLPISFLQKVFLLRKSLFQKYSHNSNKGHHISVFAEGYHHCDTFKKKAFPFPYENGSFYYGGTYGPWKYSREIDENAIEQLEKGLPKLFLPLLDSGKVCAFRPTCRTESPFSPA
jgi:hypothetical protein